MESAIRKDKGVLYVVATPIGNLEDITIRALEVLKSVSFILAEDTRETAKLLKRYGISTSMVSYRDQNHNRMIVKILEKLDAGLSLALVSDSGTPVISDPGFKLVRELVEKGYVVSPIPGASAVISALSVAGVSTDRFVYLGFLPKSDSKRIKIIQEHCNLDCTMVIYESPLRLLKLLKEIEAVCGRRQVVVANDISKVYERFIKGRASEVLEMINSGVLKLKGEFVVLIDKE